MNNNVQEALQDFTKNLQVLKEGLQGLEESLETLMQEYEETLKLRKAVRSFMRSFGEQVQRLPKEYQEAFLELLNSSFPFEVSATGYVAFWISSLREVKTEEEIDSILRKAVDKGLLMMTTSRPNVSYYRSFSSQINFIPANEDRRAKALIAAACARNDELRKPAEVI